MITVSILVPDRSLLPPHLADDQERIATSEHVLYATATVQLQLEAEDTAEAVKYIRAAEVLGFRTHYDSQGNGDEDEDWGVVTLTAPGTQFPVPERAAPAPAPHRTPATSTAVPAGESVEYEVRADGRRVAVFERLEDAQLFMAADEARQEALRVRTLVEEYFLTVMEHNFSTMSTQMARLRAELARLDQVPAKS